MFAMSMLVFGFVLMANGEGAGGVEQSFEGASSATRDRHLRSDPRPGVGLFHVAWRVVRRRCIRRPLLRGLSSCCRVARSDWTSCRGCGAVPSQLLGTEMEGNKTGRPNQGRQSRTIQETGDHGDLSSSPDMLPGTVSPDSTHAFASPCLNVV